MLVHKTKINKKVDDNKIEEIKPIKMEEENLNKVIEKKEGEMKRKTFSKRNMIVIGAVMALVIVTLLIMQNRGDSEEGIAAIVNGEVITLDELNKAFASLPPQYSGNIDKETLLNQIIQTKVIYQEAEKQGLIVKDEEANQQFQLAKISSGLTEDQFSASLLAQDITEEELINQYARQLTVQKFIDENLINKIQITNEDIQNYYSNNLEQFQLGEQVVVRHILIGTEGLTPEEQDMKAKDLLSKLTEENFCEFVKEFSTDSASVPTCGEYTFTMADAFVEEFKKLSFEQDAGEMGIVRTQFGAHIIWTKEKIPSKTISIEEVSNQINNFLKTQIAQNQYEGFYQDVSKDSEIEIIFNIS